MSEATDRKIPPDSLLEARALTSGYGRVPVIQDVDLVVRPGEVVALLGPNGAGKTTTLLTLAGELPAFSGQVLLMGAPTRAPLHRRSQIGLGYVTEEKSVFTRLSVAENLKVAGADRRRAFGLFPELVRLKNRKVGLLSGGEQQMLALARALARGPSILMADELSLGLGPLVVTRLLQAVRAVADEDGLGVLIVEQHVRNVLRYSDRAYVMGRGRIVLEGTAKEMLGRMAEIEDSYLSNRVHEDGLRRLK
jgi:branched-chain amino acid transport system ATP-binding protein